MTRRRIIIMVGVLMLLALGALWLARTALVCCVLPPTPTIVPSAAAAASVPTLTFTPSPTVTATPTATVVYEACAWAWARQDAPEVTPLAQAALDAAGIDGTVRVEFYGENCLRGNNVSYFAAMTTDFYLMLETDLADQEALAALVEQAYAALLTIPDDPNRARMGYLDMTFADGEASLRFRAMFDEIERHLDDGLSGMALVEAVGGLR